MKRMTMTLHSAFAILMLTALTACGGTRVNEQAEWSLKGTFGDRFLVGAAINSVQAAGHDTADVAIVRRHFNAIVPETCMKHRWIHPEPDRYDFEAPDQFVAFGQENGLTMTGHCLLWYKTCPDWLFKDDDGAPVDPETLKQRIREHVTTVVGRYKGRLLGWDVVNEAIMDDGSYRTGTFYDILGEDYIPFAFQCAHEADPDAELYYNDYSMHKPAKREAVVRLIRSLKEKGIRIDAVGMQAHMGMSYPDIREFEKSIEAFAAEGVKVMITEWDMSVLNGVKPIGDPDYERSVNPYPDGLPDNLSAAWNARMKSFFELYLKHSDVITRVTTWGVSDGCSWKNSSPVSGRTDYPLLFDRNYEPKPFVRELCDPDYGRQTDAPQQ